jgi:hypothetical protein
MHVQPEVLCVVEGHGEIKAVPVLLRRIGAGLEPPVYPVTPQPFRVPRSRLADKSGQLERVLLRGGLRAHASGGVLVVLDADDDCPVEVGQRLSGWATGVVPGSRVGVVVANREFESWLLAGIEPLRGRAGISPTAEWPADSETRRGAKARLDALMPEGKYKPVLHQARFAALMDIDLATERSRSFRKFVAEVTRLLSGP